ncbi:MAG: type 2 lantipeptide synthetase LanM [Clostridium sp.]|nr:type 2 lantipeptide synthetase LanM [Clostridium sp.]
MEKIRFNRKDYWLRLFPKFNEYNDLENLLLNCSGMTLEEVEKEYYNSKKKDIKLEFFYEYYNDFEKEINDVLERVKEEVPWCYFIKPLLISYTRELLELIYSSEIIENKKTFIYYSILEIVKKLNNIYLRVLIVEIRKLSLEKRLEGDTPKERGEYFRNVLLKNKEYIKSIYILYPELSRVLENTTKNQVEFIKKILTCLEEKYIELIKTFKLENKEKLIKIELGSGDTHNKGKSVSLLYFKSGIKLFFKPRNVEIDKAYYNFLSYLNNEKIEGFSKLYSPIVYSNEDRDSGWQEFVEFKECKDEKEVNNFYRRIGEILCILHLFNSKDFHYENIIAKGEYPVLIDLETILNPKVYDDYNECTALMEINKIISDSVYFSGLLPRNIISKKNKNVLDLSGLSASEEQKAQYKTMVIENYDTDEVKIVKKYMNIEIKNNNPKLGDKVIKSENYVNDIKEGFLNLYRWMLKNKKILKEKVIEFFSNKECRVVIRATMVYSQILNTSYHPELLKNTVDRKVYLSRIAISSNEIIKRFIATEYDELFYGDIPYFKVNTSDNNFFNINNNKSIIDEVCERIEKLNELDLEKQMSIINLSYEEKLRGISCYRTGIKLLNKDALININKEDALGVAEKIGKYIIRKGVKGINNGYDEYRWLSLRTVQGNRMTIMDAGLDLYEGNAGIGLFLAYLSKFTRDKEIESDALKTINPIINSLNQEKKIGFFNGISGELYALYKIGKILNNDNIKNIVLDYIPKIEELIDEDENCDITAGYAGLLLFLISIYNDTKRLGFLNLMEKIYDKIKSKSIINEYGTTWSEDGLIGFAHGNAGIEAALIKYYKVSGKKEILDLIKDSVKFEKHFFNSNKGGWPRAAINYDIYSNYWCHGNGGILLSRLILKEEGYTYEGIDKEIEFCIKELIKSGIGNDFCLCHGDVGNLLILYKACQVLKNDELKEKVLYTFINYIEKLKKENFIEKEFKFKEKNSLMIGIAGLGYGILKFLYCDEIPCILSLE